jgi:hypothetical protein
MALLSAVVGPTRLLAQLLAASHQAHVGFVTQLLAHPGLLIAWVVVWGTVAVVSIVFIAGLRLRRKSRDERAQPPPADSSQVMATDRAGRL